MSDSAAHRATLNQAGVPVCCGYHQIWAAQQRMTEGVLTTNTSLDMSPADRIAAAGNSPSLPAVSRHTQAVVVHPVHSRPARSQRAQRESEWRGYATLRERIQAELARRSKSVTQRRSR